PSCDTPATASAYPPQIPKSVTHVSGINCHPQIRKDTFSAYLPSPCCLTKFYKNRHSVSEMVAQQHSRRNTKKATGTKDKTGTITGTENPDGYKLAVTDFLNEARIRSARAKARPYKLRDGSGLYLLITPAGAKQWRLRYTLGGRESMVSLGTYPATSLKAARAKRGSLRSALESGRDPAAERRA